MTREEIRKKWKNKEFVESEGSKIQLHNNEVNKFNSQKLSLKDRVNDRVANIMQNNPVSFRDRVETRAQGIMNRNNQLANVENPILEYGKTRQDKYNEYKNMKRITGKDLGMFAKNLALGGYNGGVSAARQNEYLSQQRSEGYRTFNQIQTRVNEQMKNKTADEKLKYNIEQLNKSKSVNGVLVQEQMKINDTSTMKMYNAEEERINKKIAKNAENTDTVAGKYLAGEIAPSMGQSLVGTGLDIIAPGMGSAYRMLSYSGNYTQDGLLKGMTEDNAAMYGLTMAGVETVMDTIGDKMKGIAIGEAKTAKGLKETIKITAKELGINSFFEGSGEALTEPLQELIASLYGGTADYENISSRMVQSFLAGAVSELLMTGSSLGYGSSINAMNKIKNGEQVSTKEIASALKEINQKEEVDIKNILKDNLNFAEQSLIQSNSKQIDKKTSNKLENIATQLSNEELVNVVNILKKEKEDMINNSNLTDVQKQKLMEITNKYDLGKDDIRDLINKTSMIEKEQVKTPNNDISQTNQQVIPQEQNQAQNANIEQIKLDSENFARQVDDYVSGNIKSSDFINVSSTPKVLQDIGLPDNQIILKQSKLKTILKESDNPNSNLHGLPVETVKRIPEAISNPLNVLNSSSNENSVVVITDLADKMDRPIIVSIEMNYKGQIGNIEFLSNRLTSAYGKNNYDNFMKTEIEKGNLLYDIDEGIIKELPASTRLQLSEGVSSSVDTNDNVSTTNNIIPQNEKNMQVQSQNANMEQTEATQNSVDNNTDLMYNNLESESDINEGDIKGYTIQGRDRIYEEAQNNRQYNWGEYTKWEQSIKPIPTEQFTETERQIVSNSKLEYNKDVVVYDENNNDTTYSGGASRAIKDKIMISRQQAEIFGLDSMIDHENVESDIMHNETANDILSPIVDFIIEDANFVRQKEEFWKTQEENMPSDSLIAKDILCDRFSERRRGKKLDYDNVLNPATNSSIDMALDNYYKQVYGKDLLTFDYNSSSDTTRKQDITENKIEELKQSSSFNVSKNKPTRHDVIQKNREIARDNIKNISKWKDKSNGAKYQLETMERNVYDIIPDKQEAKKVIDTYFTPVHESEAEKQRFINKYNDKIRELDLNKYEAEATQFLGELKYNPDFKITPELKNVLDRVNDNIQKGKVDKEKVAKSIDTFRNIYDELFEIENTTLREQGYKEKPYRRGYFPHFIDYVEETRTEKVLAKLGFKIDKRSLPTDIAGITEQFVPGKTWNRSALQRKTNKTDFNVLKGFDTYIAQAADNIFHTENIQKLRGLENEIRYQYSEKGIQADIDNIVKNESLNAEEKQALIDQKFEQVANPMPNLVVELRRYTNALANKKSSTDRGPEDFYGRPFYSIVNAIENRFAGNAVGLNIGSALTNFIPITQAYSQVGSVNMGRAMLDTMKSYIKDDGFVDKSAFLTSRLNSSDKLYKTTLEQVSEKANIAFDVVDSVASNIVVRGKYLENIKNGMSETEAIKEADSFARSVMADRSKGALPTKFEEKNPLTKAFTQFQLEVNNQYRYMFKDIPRDLAEKGLGKIALAYFKMFVSAWLYNKFSEEVTGRDQAFSPIDLVKSSYDTIQDEELSTYNKITSIATEAGEQLPFVGGLLGGGRVPVSGALPSLPNIAKAGVGWASGEMNTKKALSTLGKEVTKPAYYLLPPFGGGQLKKTVEGIKTVVDGGSYGIDKEGNKNLQFPVEDKSATNYIKAGLFGKYALPRAKSYVEDGFKSLNVEQTEVYEKTNIDFNKLKEYFLYSKADNVKKDDKMEHIINMNISTDNQWELYKYNIFSSSERDDGTSQVTDAEYAIKNKMATKKEYMKLYKEAEKNKVEFPNGEKLEELKNNKLKLSTYMKYKIEVKKATNEKKKKMLPVSDDSKVLSDKDKINLIQNNDYTEEERRTIYANYIGKDDDTYNTLSKLQDGETNIDAYLDYKLQDFTGDEDTSSNIVGKKVSGSSKNKTMEYLRKSSLTDIEKIYIVGTKYANELNESQKIYIYNLVNKKITDEKELNKILKKFKDLEQHKNGEWHWKEYK